MMTPRHPEDVSLPLPLKLVGAATILSGLWPAFDMAYHLSNGVLTLNPAVLQIPVGIGLLLRKRSCRTVLLLFHWLGLLGLLFTVIAAASGATVNVVASVLLLAYLVWEYRVLTDPGVKRLFLRPA
jgi:hypothetical protein